MNLRLKVAAAAAALGIGLVAGTASRAAIIDWTFSDGTFDLYGATFSGTLRFDSVANVIIDWHVVTTSFQGTTYSSPAGCVSNTCNEAYAPSPGPFFDYVIDPASDLRNEWIFELTDVPLGTPGVVAVLTGDQTFYTPDDPILTPNHVTGGQAVGVLAVPEPAAWVLMIGGLGLAGAALRRRRSVAA